MKKLLILMLAVVMIFSTASCGRKPSELGKYDDDKAADTENTLDIVTLNKGYGTKWLVALADAYTELHPEVKITIRTETQDATITALLETGEGHYKYDLFFAGTNILNFIKSALADPSNTFLADLTEVYNAEPDGTPVKETMDPSMLEAFRNKKSDGSEIYYTMPWVQSTSSLLVNNEVLEKYLGANWQEEHPIRTTAELEEVAALLDPHVSPFVHAADTDFYHFLYEAWWAQYEGLDSVADFYNGFYTTATGERERGPGIFLQDGRLKSMEALASLLDPAKGYFYPTSNGIGWNEAQSRFMVGEAAFFPNGDWHDGEMKKTYPNADIIMIRVPMVSGIKDKLGITETELRQAVSYADAVLDGETATKPALNPSGKYSADEVLAEVLEARTITFSYSNFYTAFAASYGKGLSHAKDFLIFMASEAGQKVYAKAMQGPTLPFGYDVSEDAEIWNDYSDFAKSRWSVASNATYYFRRSDLPLGGVGLVPYKMVADAPLEVLVSRDNDRKTAKQIYDADYEYYKVQSVWDDLMRRAGLIR